MDKFRHCGIKYNLEYILITGRNEVVAKVIFLHLSVIHSVHMGGLPQCMLGYHHPPRSRHPPGADTPPEQTPPEQTPHSGSRHPPPQEQTPPTPQEADSSIRSTNSRYASYWNAFLFEISFYRHFETGLMKTFKTLPYSLYSQVIYLFR